MGTPPHTIDTPAPPKPPPSPSDRPPLTRPRRVSSYGDGAHRPLPEHHAPRPLPARPEARGHRRPDAGRFRASAGILRGRRRSARARGRARPHRPATLGEPPPGRASGPVRQAVGGRSGHSGPQPRTRGGFGRRSVSTEDESHPRFARSPHPGCVLPAAPVRIQLRPDCPANRNAREHHREAHRPCDDGTARRAAPRNGTLMKPDTPTPAERPSAADCAEAAAWIAKLHGEERTAKVEMGFRRWLAASAAHRVAAEMASDVWTAAERLPKSQSPPIVRLGSVSAVLTLPRALAAAALGVLIVGALYFYRSDPAIETRLGEQRSVT